MKKLSVECCKKVGGSGPYRPAKPKSEALNKIACNVNKLGFERGRFVP